jgi:hypothetical protein
MQHSLEFLNFDMFRFFYMNQSATRNIWFQRANLFTVPMSYLVYIL